MGKTPSEWKIGVSTYEEISLGEVFEGVEIRLKSKPFGFEKVFLIHPGADPQRIKGRFLGAKNMKVDANGNLVVEAGKGKLIFSKPVAYQEANGERQYINVSYVVAGNSFSFKLGPYDRSKLLVIDPCYEATFIGGSREDSASDIAINKDGYVYIVGTTDSIDFPVKGFSSSSINKNCDERIFVAKFDPRLTQLVAAAIIGTSSGCGSFPGWSRATSLGIASDGSVYVGGKVFGKGFPVTFSLAPSRSCLNGGVVLKLSSDLSELEASVYVGYTSSVADLAVSENNEIYIAGFLPDSDSEAFPASFVKRNGEMRDYTDDIFVLKFDKNLSSVRGSALLGGSGHEESTSVALDVFGNVYVAGVTSSFDFPTTANAYMPTVSAGPVGFVVKLNRNLSSILSSTYFGEGTVIRSVALDSEGNVYLAGFSSPSSDISATPGAFMEKSPGGDDAFVSKFNSNLTQLLASTYLGGESEDRANKVIVDAKGSIIVTGYTKAVNFPTKPAVNGVYGGKDVFITCFKPDLSDVIWSYLHGGSEDDSATSMAIGPLGKIFVCGETSSEDFPASSIAYNTEENGWRDAFVFGFGPEYTPPNHPPIADAGGDHLVIQGSKVYLDGSDSYDPDGDLLTYNWKFLLKPEGSIATLSDPNAEKPYFYADKVGFYILELVVNDGRLDSKPDKSIVVSLSKTPYMWIMTDRIDFGTVPIGSSVESTIYIGNLGVKNLEVSSITLEGDNKSDFKLAGTDSCDSIRAGRNCHFQVFFIPNSEGEKKARLVIKSNDPRRSSYRISLTGRATSSEASGAKPVPVSKDVGMEEPDIAPVKVINGSCNVSFNYLGKVDIVIGILSCDFKKIYWLHPNCTFNHKYGKALSQGQNLQCTGINLTENSGYVFWIVSSVPIEALDWNNGPYELKFYSFGSCR